MLENTYSAAVPLGPIMELPAQDAQNTFTSEVAAQSLDYWQRITEQIIADPEAPQGSDPRCLAAG